MERRHLVGLGFAVLLAACGGGSDDDDGDGVYQNCVDADQCEAPDDFDPVCLEKGDDGFCTATCEVDDDCEDADFVCASFESNEESLDPSCTGTK